MSKENKKITDASANAAIQSANLKIKSSKIEGKIKNIIKSLQSLGIEVDLHKTYKNRIVLKTSVFKDKAGYYYNKPQNLAE
jgi:hypothetical protein